MPRGLENFIECLPDGNWSTTQLACLKPGCYASNVKFGKFDNFWTELDTVGQIECIQGAYFNNTNLPVCVTPNNDVGAYQWQFQDGQPNCTFPQFCDSSPCGEHGSCIQMIDNYTCACDVNYRFEVEQPVGQQCKAIDQCLENTDLCSNAKCIKRNDSGAKYSRSYSCECLPGSILFTNNTNTQSMIIPNSKDLRPGQSCIRNRCALPTVDITSTANFIFENESSLFLANTKLNVYCSNHTGPLASLQCLTNGTWNGEIPASCQPTTCQTITLPNNATLIFNAKSSYQVHDIVHFECVGHMNAEQDYGYYLVGRNSTLCQPNGQWSNMPPICVLPQCSAIPVHPDGHPNLTAILISPKTPTNEPFAENAVVNFMCQIEETILMACKWTGPCSTTPIAQEVYNKLNSSPKACNLDLEDNIQARIAHLDVGQEATFTCMQPNYVLSHVKPVKCVNREPSKDVFQIAGLRSKRQQPPQISQFSSPLNRCLSERHGASTIFEGASAIFYFQIASECQQQQNTIRWIHKPTSQIVPSIYSNGKSVVFFNSAQIFNQGEYVCQVLDQAGETVDSGTWKLNVSLGRKQKSWKEIIQQSQPSTVIAMDSTQTRDGWNSSLHWSQLSDGSWLYTPNRSWKDYLITPMVEANTNWLSISVDLGDCNNCLVWLSYFSSESSSVSTPSMERFQTLGGATVDPNSHSIQFVLPFPQVWILITVDSSSSSFRLNSLKFTVTACPRIQLGMTSLQCTPQGLWFVNGQEEAVFSGLCACEQGYVEEFTRCVPRGPLCYSCLSSPQSNCTFDTDAQYCSSDQVCQSTTHFPSSDQDIDFNRCRNGNEECSLCCAQDNCNWGPQRAVRLTTTTSTTTTTPSTTTTTSTARPSTTSISPSTTITTPSTITVTTSSTSTSLTTSNTPTTTSTTSITTLTTPNPKGNMTLLTTHMLSTPPPICLDLQPIKLYCQNSLTVRRLGKFFYEPTALPWPKAEDNDPNFSITNNLPAKLFVQNQPYPFSGTEESILWTVVDRHGQRSTCTTQLVFEDTLPPQLTCPEVYVDDVYGSSSKEVPIRVPLSAIQLEDDSLEEVQLTMNPANNSLIEVDTPVLIKVSAVDAAGNKAQCQFWYQALIKDCPFWQIDMEEFNCTTSSNKINNNEHIVVCYLKKPCPKERRQIPENFRALTCIPGQEGWRMVEEGLGSTVMGPPMNKAPVCLEDMSSTITLSIAFGLLIQQWSVQPKFHKSCNKNWTHFYIQNAQHEVLTCIQQITTSKLASKHLPKLPLECQSKIRSHTIIYHLLCPEGWGANRNLKCEKCPAVTMSAMNPAISTIHQATTSQQKCIPFCSPGFFSSTGLAPCQICPRGSFQSNFGQKSCFQCAFDLTTTEVGAKSAKECTNKCTPGQFSFAKKFCALCPEGYFQQNFGSTFCQRCPFGTTTSTAGATNALQCRASPSGCGNPQCSDRGKCLGNGQCKCEVGYTATDCSVVINVCSAAYCLNGASLFLMLRMVVPAAVFLVSKVLAAKFLCILS
uniref:Uncharacterized protein n=1 Tax=Ditylenchus dipsaci TaxID=166011 RepID=A0A915EAV1_9BILA